VISIENKAIKIYAADKWRITEEIPLHFWIQCTFCQQRIINTNQKAYCRIWKKARKYKTL